MSEIRVTPNAPNSIDITIDRSRIPLKDIKLTIRVADDLTGRLTIASSNREDDGIWHMAVKEDDMLGSSCLVITPYHVKDNKKSKTRIGRAILYDRTDTETTRERKIPK